MPPTRISNPSRRVQYGYDGMNVQVMVVPGFRVNDRRSYASLSSATVVSAWSDDGTTTTAVSEGDGNGGEKNKENAKVASANLLLESVARGYDKRDPLRREHSYAFDDNAMARGANATTYYYDTDANSTDQIIYESPDAVQERDAPPACTRISDPSADDVDTPMCDDAARAVLRAVYAYLVVGDWRELSSADVLRLNAQVARLRSSMDDTTIAKLVLEEVVALDSEGTEDTPTHLPLSNIPTLEWEWAMELVARDRAFDLVEIPHTSVRARHELAALELLARRGVAVSSDDILDALNAEEYDAASVEMPLGGRGGYA